MFFRLQRMSVYFAKLLESKAHPLWGFDDPIDPRGFAREVITNQLHTIVQHRVPATASQNERRTLGTVAQQLQVGWVFKPPFQQRLSKARHGAPYI